jgi:hypothetical protein
MAVRKPAPRHLAVVLKPIQIKEWNFWPLEMCSALHAPDDTQCIAAMLIVIAQLNL